MTEAIHETALLPVIVEDCPQRIPVEPI